MVFRVAVAIGTFASVLGLAACSPTTYDESRAPSTAVSTTTTTPTGTVTELLTRLSSDALGLSSVMIADGDAGAAAEQIAALWAAARADVQAKRPDLVESFDANVDRSTTAVQYRRAADADKAARNLDALVSAFLAS